MRMLDLLTFDVCMEHIYRELPLTYDKREGSLAN